ncbi:hypothetical protein G7054_g5877 [Neopestalotiopsis clavispora]|nr:hypothetical protein G7054_g5877 [Neopestalotiopsis clavispora]
MEYLRPQTKQLKSDLALFSFDPVDEFRIRTVTLTFDNGSVDFQTKDLHSEKEYLDWVKNNFHGDFQFQTSSLVVQWVQGTVNRSDTSILGFEDDLLLSTTYFKTKPWTFSVMYGSTPEYSGELVARIKRLKKSAFHPLMMPMVFAEHERSRFMESMELKGATLKASMLDLKNSLDEDQFGPRKQSNESARAKNRKMTEKDLESTDSWIGVSDLKIGFESFRQMLLVVREQFNSVGELKPRFDVDDTDEKINESIDSEILKGRLQEMDAEIDTKTRQCEGLLSGMALAIQVEWNHYTRRDAKANIIIARLSRRDSTQMKLMSLVGMIFLPGTFLATLFSMSFFRWIPDDSPQMVSPYVSVYFGLTAIITAMTVYFWHLRDKKNRNKDDPELDLLFGEIDRNDLEKGQRVLGPLEGKQSQDSDRTRETNGIELEPIAAN